VHPDLLYPNIVRRLEYSCLRVVLAVPPVCNNIAASEQPTGLAMPEAQALWELVEARAVPEAQALWELVEARAVPEAQAVPDGS
jgi:hypothetical protein